MIYHEGTRTRSVSLEEVERVASLARLDPAPDEKVRLAGEMSRILDYVRQLDELDTAEVEPLHHVLDLRSVLRDDEPRESLPVAEALKNAPARKGDFFLVPKVVDKG